MCIFAIESSCRIQQCGQSIFLHRTPFGVKLEFGVFLYARGIAEISCGHAFGFGIPTAESISLAFGRGRLGYRFSRSDIVKPIIPAVHFIGIIVHKYDIRGRIIAGKIAAFI